jgi:glycosyltransferase
MNKGIRLATGEVVGTLNADDFYPHPRVLESVALVFNDPAVEACYGDLVFVKEQVPSAAALSAAVFPSGSAFRVVRSWRAGPCTPRRFYWGWMPPHPTFFVRRRAYERYGLYRLDLGTAADYELMLRFVVKHGISIRYVPEVLVNMRAGGVSTHGLANRLAAHRMDHQAWRENGLKPYPWTVILKPLRKIGQLFC